MQPIFGRPVHPFDHTWGTDTGGLIPREELVTGHASDQHVTAYYGIAPSILEALIDLWLQRLPSRQVEKTTFLDLGAGKGRALMGAALHPFRAAVGVELNGGLVQIARENLRRFSTAAPLLSLPVLLEGDVLEAPLPSGPLLVSLFHPFEAPLLRRMLLRLVAETAGEPVDLLYINAEHLPTIEENSDFAHVWAGKVPMSTEDHLADLAEIASQTEYGSTGDEFCAIYRKR